MRILTTDEVRQAEREATNRPNVSTLILMQRAGYAVAQFCLSQFKFTSVCAVCSHNNHGGNGLVAAEALRDLGINVSVIILAKEISELDPDTATICSQLQPGPIWVSALDDFESEAVTEALAADLIIDAIIGGDFILPLPLTAKKAVDAINNSAAIVVSVDLPSGIDGNSRVPAHENGADAVFSHGIIAFIAPRPAHVFAELTSGPIAISDIGVQPVLVPNETAVNVITGEEVGIAFPPRINDAHKSGFGHLLVIAGSLGKAGAAALAGIAALRSGVGLVTVACPKSIQAAVAAFAPELMTEGLEETGAGAISTKASDTITDLLAGKDVVVLGPGLSREEETCRFVRRLVARCPLPLVLDADGLNAFDGHYRELQVRSSRYRVLTPNPGEAARLLGISVEEVQKDRLKTAQRICHDTGFCVVLKGFRTVVAGASGETWLNMSGNPALAKSGSGDVLCGVIGAALANKRLIMSRLSGTEEEQQEEFAVNASALMKDISVAAAVHLHGLAGDVTRDQMHENTVLATDLLKNLSEAFRECEVQIDRGLFYLQR